MDGDKQVSLVLVSNICAGTQRNKHIRLAGEDNIHFGVSLLDHLAQLQSGVQVQRLLAGYTTYSTRVIATVTGINNYGKSMHRKADRHTEQHTEKYTFRSHTNTANIIVHTIRFFDKKPKSVQSYKKNPNFANFIAYFIIFMANT